MMTARDTDRWQTAANGLRACARGVRQDVQFAARQFRRSFGVAALAVITLALGVGANTAIFSVVHQLLLAPLPYPNGGRVVMPVETSDPSDPGPIAPALARAWQARTHVVAAIGAASEALFSLRPDGAVDTIPVARITANLLPMLGVRPAMGRGFAPGEERDSLPAVAMVSYGVWQRAYGGRADVLGATVAVEGRPLTVVGVTPAGFNLPLSRNPVPDVWVPATLEAAADGGSGALIPGPVLFATLRPGATADAASRELQAVARAMPAEAGVRVPDAPPRPSVRVLRPQDFLGARERRSVQVLFVAVGALLLIACANVANLLLARAWARQREFAVRTALGAGRTRLARQVLTESLLLALAGGLLGVGVAWLALKVILALRPPALDHLAGVRLAPAVLLWSVGVSVATGLLFGAAPALLAAARQAGDVLRRETRGGSAGVASRHVRSGLIVLEIATSLVLLVASGLLVRSFDALQQMPLGFEPRGLVYADALLGDRRYRDRRSEFRDAILRRLRALPGVTGVAIGTMPGKAFRVLGGLEAEAERGGQPTRVPELGTVFMTPEYVRVARIALLTGRLPDTSTLTPAWRAGPPQLSPEVLVNREFARRVWPNGRALGARVREGPGWATVVGVVDDTRMPEVRGDAAALQVYSLFPPRLGDVPFVVRTAGSGDIAAPAVKRAIAAVHPAVYVRQVLSGDTYLRDGLAPTRFAMALLTAFAGVALVLAAVGLYGVVAYGVSQRTREIGVRLALGAEPRAVVTRVVGGGLRLAAVGVAVGTATAAATTRVLGSMLYGVRPADPPTFCTVALLVVAIALVASYVPARRALRIDPTAALRAD